jgi:hypothetical protein
VPGSFPLPPDVTVRKERHGDAWAHVFRHTRLGDLGRVVLRPRPDGQTDFAAEIAGHPGDPMRPEREAVFGPLVRRLAESFERAVAERGLRPGPPTGPLAPRDEAPPRRRIRGEIVPCDHCDEPVALLVFADDATDPGGLEDAARLMHGRIAEADLPTWIVGPPIPIDPSRGPALLDDDSVYDVLKVWPEREPVRRLDPTVFDAELDVLAYGHCA